MSYNLITLLNTYTHSLLSEAPPSIRQEVQNKLLNVMIIGLRHLKPHQAQALLHFKSTLVAHNLSENPVVKAIDNSDILLQILHLGPDIQTLIHSYQDVSIIKDLPDAEKLRVGSYAITRILNAENTPNPAQISALSQFSKILLVFWNAPFVLKDKPHLYKKLNTLIQPSAHQSNASPSTTSQFVNIAKTLLKSQEDAYYPEEITNCTAFHGQALSEGLQQATEIISQYNIPNYNLTDFAVKYCEDHLKSRQYLIRPSSTVVNKVDSLLETRYFTAVVSYKKNDANQLYNTRITQIIRAGNRISWKLGNPSDPEFVKQDTHDSLDALLKSIFKGYTPCPPPSQKDLSNYIANVYAN